MDVQKQIDYWRASGEEDIQAAETLLEKGHLRHALFFAHLAMEKTLKAHVTRQMRDVPPRTHNLVRLAELAGLEIAPEQVAFLREFGVYQLEGRYPHGRQGSLDADIARRDLAGVEEMLRWLTARL